MHPYLVWFDIKSLNITYKLYKTLFFQPYKPELAHWEKAEEARKKEGEDRLFKKF